MSKMSFVFTVDEYSMLQAIVGRQLTDLHGQTMAALLDNLGDEGADRFLEKLQLIGLAAEQEQAEKETSDEGAIRCQQ